VQYDGVFSLHRQVIRSAGRVRGQLQLPAAIPSRLGFQRLAGNSERNRFARRRPAPNGHRYVALQHGMIAEKQRQGDFGAGFFTKSQKQACPKGCPQVYCSVD
jgi:hypothetical protein